MESFIPFLPPILAFLLGVLTHRILLSLFTGWLLAFLLSPQGALLATAKATLQIDRLFVLSFILLSTILFELMLATGTLKSLMQLSLKRFKNAKSVETSALALSHLLCFDGCFSSLVTSSLFGPLGDQRGVPRVKTALIADSMAGPLVALCPLSCFWALILTMLPVHEGMSWHHFLHALPFLFYSITLVASLWLVVQLRITIGPMQRFECEQKNVSASLAKGSVLSSLITLGLLPAFMLCFFFFWGLDHLSWVLFLSCLTSLSIATLYFLMKKEISPKEALNIWKRGAKDSLTTIAMILVAWSLANLIEDQLFLSHAMKSLHWEELADWSLPVLLFTMTAITSTALGTSWGTISIFLPLLGPILFSLTQEATLLYEHNLFYPSLAAIISGSVFGDHVSLLSDTTLLASKGARCSPIDHIKTQWPYVIPVLAGTLVGFTLLGIFTEENMQGAFIVPLLASLITSMTLSFALDTKEAPDLTA